MGPTRLVVFAHQAIDAGVVTSLAADAETK